MPVNPPWHIVSLVVYCRPSTLLAIRDSIEAMPQTEIHADDGHAKLVVTIEGADTHQLTAQMDELRLLPGSLSVQMVFHQEDDGNPADDNHTPATTNHPQGFRHEA